MSMDGRGGWFGLGKEWWSGDVGNKVRRRTRRVEVVRGRRIIAVPLREERVGECRRKSIGIVKEVRSFLSHTTSTSCGGICIKEKKKEFQGLQQFCIHELGDSSVNHSIFYQRKTKGM